MRFLITHNSLTNHLFYVFMYILYLRTFEHNSLSASMLPSIRVYCEKAIIKKVGKHNQRCRLRKEFEFRKYDAEGLIEEPCGRVQCSRHALVEIKFKFQLLSRCKFQFRDAP
jgi:hypothetical protein